MPALRNIKRERFCQNMLNGAKDSISQAAAYRLAGYKAAAGHPAEVAASRLLSTDEVQHRIAELLAPAARKAGVTVETLLAEYDEVRDLAKADQQLAVAKSATDSKGKLTGLMRDKVEIGAPGDFDGLSSFESVVERIMQDTKPADMLAILDAVRDAIEAAAGSQAIVVNTYVPLQPPVPFNIPWRKARRQ